MMEQDVIARLVKTGRRGEALDLLEQAAHVCRQRSDQAGLAQAIHQRAALLLDTAPAESLSLCAQAEEILLAEDRPFQALQVQLTSCQALLARGGWQPAARHCSDGR